MYIILRPDFYCTYASIIPLHLTDQLQLTHNTIAFADDVTHIFAFTKEQILLSSSLENK